VKVFYSPDYVAAAESFDTTRKAAWIADSLSKHPIAGVDVVAPTSLTFEEIATVHDPVYVKAVRRGEPKSLAESQGFKWDAGMWKAVTSSNGGAVAAACAALTDGAAGSLSSGLHHAQHATGAAYCTFNGLVLAAKKVLSEGAKSVLILDLDAHCGGGTYSLFDSDDHSDRRIRQVDISVNALDAYWANGDNRLDIVRHPENYLPTIEERLAELESFTPDLCVYNAGMDPDERCMVGGFRGIDAAILKQREKMVFSWAKRRGIPIAFVLAGGYAGGALSQDGLVDLHRLTIETAANC
jgi:acetoin utilization deacetylase AcuC-like enzyme